jgi:hypothetical protein
MFVLALSEFTLLSMYLNLLLKFFPIGRRGKKRAIVGLTLYVSHIG